MEKLLIVSLQILRLAGQPAADHEKPGKRLKQLNARREALLKTLPDGVPQTAADRVRWELVRYLNCLAQQKIAAKI